MSLSIRTATTALILFVAGSASAQTPPPAAAPPPPACTAPEHRQFDFWVGRWDVYPTGTQRLVAHSLIERLYADCVIRESWMPIRGGGGSSLNTWRPGERHWRQLWADSTNSWIEFSGGLEGPAMVLTASTPAANGSPSLTRMTYTTNPDGSVRQAGTVSSDGGQTWQPSFDFTYVRAAGSS
jgi:hypothetical protein